MADEQRIRQLLHHTWHPFYGRFGRLRPIQREATVPICRGEDVLVGAPTASGKTEAVVAPMVERVLRNTIESDTKGVENQLRILLVAPTRALARDLHRRLEGPVETCGLKVGVKTGDTGSLDYDNLPSVLTTTLESLDSMLARHPRSLRNLRGIVLDELHLLHGSPRGDQLQCLLERCRRVVDEDSLQVCGASATLADGMSLARIYLSDSARFVSTDAETADLDESDDAPSQRSLEAELLSASTLDDAATLIADVFRRRDGRKLLVFANARSQVEELTSLLAADSLLDDRVVSHHGSLSRAERLRAESKLRDAPAAICVATMTLEVGIDIGDVDRTILVGAPPDVSSLLQRIGRANRRESVTKVTCLYEGEFEKLRMTHLLECASKGQLFTESVPFRPTVVPQQALSLMFQNPDRWIDAGSLHARLSEEARHQWDRTDCREILRTMADDGILHAMRRERFTGTATADTLYEYGQIHSNIEEDREVEVIDEMTRQVVGTVRFSDSHRQQLMEGDDLAVSLGGEGREIVSMSEDRLISRARDDTPTEDSQFIGRQPPRYSRSLAEDFARFLDVPSRTIVLDDQRAQETVVLYHFLGTVWGRLYEQMLRDENLVKKRGSHGAFFIFLDREPASVENHEQSPGRYFDPSSLRSRAESALKSRRSAFMRMLGAGPNLDWLPADIIDRWLRRAIDLEQFTQVLTDSRIESRAI